MKNEPLKRKKDIKMPFYEEDIRLYDRVKFILSTYVEPLEFKFLDENIGFSVLLLEINKEHIDKAYTFLNKKIRKSDFLIKVFEDSNFYLLIAQDTQSEGAVQFSNRIIKDLSYIAAPEYKIDSSVLKVSFIAVEKEYVGIKRLSYEIVKNIIFIKESDKMWVKVTRF